MLGWGAICCHCSSGFWKIVIHLCSKIFLKYSFIESRNLKVQRDPKTTQSNHLPKKCLTSVSTPSRLENPHHSCITDSPTELPFIVLKVFHNIPLLFPNPLTRTHYFKSYHPLPNETAPFPPLNETHSNTSE